MRLPSPALPADGAPAIPITQLMLTLRYQVKPRAPMTLHFVPLALVLVAVSVSYLRASHAVSGVALLALRTVRTFDDQQQNLQKRGRPFF